MSSSPSREGLSGTPGGPRPGCSGRSRGCGMIGLPYPGAAPPRHRDRHGPPARARATRAGCRCTSAARPSTTCRTSATAATPWSSTSCGGTCSSAASTSHYVSNVTDVDDNIIKRAADRGPDRARGGRRVRGASGGRPWTPSGVLRPTDAPHATAYVADMVALVADLVDRGVAYETSDGVYLEVDRVDGYGLLARQPLESLRAGARVEADEEKRSPLDFVLWKKAKPGEPSWASPWGPGRPGLAHRVRGHVARPAGGRVRPARRRPGPGLPPPRERAGPGGGRRAGRSPATGSTTAG